MDSYSGRIPLNFISFYLGITTETQGTSGVPSVDDRPGESDQTVPGSVTTTSEPRPPSNFSGSSVATEESLSTYAERTMKAIIARDQPGSSGISALLSPLNEQTEDTSGGKGIEQGRPGTSSQKDAKETHCTSVEKAVSGQIEEDDASIVSTPVVGRSIDPALYYTDTSGPEDLMDSSGVGGPVTPQFKNIPTLVKVPRQRGESTSGDESSNGLPGPSDQQSKAPRQFSASGRTLLRKHFVEKDPIVIPRNQPVIALTESQIHTVMKTISDETILSSFHLMKSLLLQATSGKVLTKEKCRHVGGHTPGGRRSPSSSGDETTDVDSPNEGYTSGAFNTDDELGSLSFCLEKETERCESPTATSAQPCTITENSAARRDTSMSPGSNYSIGDYAPLSSLVPKPGKAMLQKSPPRKRRKYMGKPGKSMKEAYFKGILWTKTFVTGPLDPAHNQYKFYCRICKSNVSIRSKGAKEIVRHYQTESHLRKDQNWRYTHLKKVDAITGITTHQVRGKNGAILTPLELEKEKPFFENAPLVDLGGEFPFYEEYLARMEGRRTTSDSRDATQIVLIGTMVPVSGDLALLQTLWTQIGIHMDHQEAFLPLDWGSAKLTVSCFHVLRCRERPFPKIIFSFRLGDFPSYLHLWNRGHLTTDCD